MDNSKKIINWKCIFYSFVILLFADGIFANLGIGIGIITTLGSLISGIIYTVYLIKEKSIAEVILNFTIFIAIILMFAFAPIF